jgi:hypothetical protein
LTCDDGYLVSHCLSSVDEVHRLSISRLTHLRTRQPDTGSQFIQCIFGLSIRTLQIHQHWFKCSEWIIPVWYHFRSQNLSGYDAVHTIVSVMTSGNKPW